MKKLLAASAIVASLVLTGAANADSPKPGGSIVMTYKDDLATLDPAVGYDWQNWGIIRSIFDGLMDYKPGTTELVPDLAESYTLSDDGRTYTFTLRDGIKFADGSDLTAQIYAAQLNHLALVVCGGEEPIIPGSEGLANQHVLDALYRSAIEKREMDV